MHMQGTPYRLLLKNPIQPQFRHLPNLGRGAMSTGGRLRLFLKGQLIKVNHLDLSVACGSTTNTVLNRRLTIPERGNNEHLISALTGIIDLSLGDTFLFRNMFVLKRTVGTMLTKLIVCLVNMILLFAFFVHLNNWATDALHS